MIQPDFGKQSAAVVIPDGVWYTQLKGSYFDGNTRAQSDAGSAVLPVELPRFLLRCRERADGSGAAGASG